MEVSYRLRGPLPEGDYHLTIDGYQQTHDGVLHAEVFYRPQNGGAPVTIMTVDGHPPGDPNSAVYVDETVHHAAIAAACHDEVVVRVQAVSGGTFFIEVAVTMIVP